MENKTLFIIFVTLLICFFLLVGLALFDTFDKVNYGDAVEPLIAFSASILIIAAIIFGMLLLSRGERTQTVKTLLIIFCLLISLPVLGVLIMISDGGHDIPIYTAPFILLIPVVLFYSIAAYSQEWSDNKKEAAWVYNIAIGVLGAFFVFFILIFLMIDNFGFF